MYAKWAFRKSSKREGDMRAEIALEAREIVRHAASPIPAGENVKGQMRRACRALGYPDDSWRILSAWKGEAAAWSAEALELLRHRYHLWQAKQERRANSETQKLAAIYAALAERLGQTDEDFHREDIAALLSTARRLSQQDDGP